MHYCIAVFGQDPEKIIAKYDEQLEGIFLKPKEQFIKEKRVYNQWYKEHYYDKYIKNPAEYKKKHPHASEDHFKYIANFIKVYNMTDDEIMEKEYASHKKDNEYINKTEEKYTFPNDGGIYLPYNNFGKWDWYQIGGRWVNMLKLKEPGACKLQGSGSLLFDNDEKSKIMNEKKSGYYCDSALIKDIDWNDEEMKNFNCFGLVLENGDWYDKDYCIIDGKYEDPLTEEEMEEFLKKTLKTLPETTQITIIDIHS